MKVVLDHSLRLLLMLGLLVATGAVAERTFKWVDEEGNVHYGDRVPQKYTKQERREINELGRTVKVYEAPLTPEEKAEQERLAAIEAEKKQRREAQEEADRVLLATYSSESDLLLQRDAKLGPLDSLIQLTDDRIRSMQERLAELTASSTDYERSGKPIPSFLQHQIGNIEEQIVKNEEFAEGKRAEMEAIRQQFASDITRYRELQAANQTQ